MRHVPRTPLLPVGLALACAVPLGPAPGALAATPARGDEARPSIRVMQDPLFDVRQPAEANSDEYVGAPERTVGDITKVRLRHRPHRVTVKIHTQELAEPEGEDYQVIFAGAHLRTTRDSFYVYLVRDTEGRVLLFGRDGEEPRRCRGIRRDFDLERDLVRISVPRSCLERPRWVRAVGSMAYSWPGGGDGDYYVDTAPDSSLTDPVRAYDPRAWHPGS